MSIDIKDNNGVSVVYITGDMDINSSPAIKKECEKIIATNKSNILINFQDMQYIDSSGLATIVSFFKIIKVNGGKLMLCSLSEKVMKLFIITRLDKLFTIIDTEEQALKLF